MSKPLTKDFESMKIAKLITLNNGSNQNVTQHTKNVQEQVIMQKSLALAELSWSLAKFNDKNPRGRFIILSDKNKRF